jgi:tRNA dimethylallyltransferase
VTTLRCLVGPTAGGKTRMGVEVALALRERGLEAEIVSCDSMGVYRGLDIVADTPSMDERRGVVHHLLGIVDPDEEFNAIRYRDLARAVIDDIASRGRIPMLVGGTGLYFRAVVDELEFAPTSAEVRAQLEQEDPDVLFERLREHDPASAERLDPRNVRRVIRAVEVMELTGRPPSELRTSWQRGGGPYGLVVAGLVWDRATLLRRGAERVQRELDGGLIDEVARVGPENFSRTARQALGVKEMIPVIEGEADIETAKAVLVKNTKSFIRRQLSWFQPDDRVDWVDASELGWERARERITDMFAAGA